MWFVNFIKSIGKWINIQIEWGKSFLQEDNGKASSKRILSFIVILSFVRPYAFVSTKNGQLEDIPTTWAIMIASILGLNIIDYFVRGYVGKTVMSDKEKSTGINPTAGITQGTTEVKP